MDANFNRDKCIAQSGIVIRDEKGVLIGGHTSRFPAFSPIVAEAIAVREAMNLANNCNMGSVFIESNCQVLVRAYRNETKVGEITSIISDLKTLSDVNPNLHITWVAREGNKLAHSVAQLGSQNSLSLMWIRAPLRLLMDIMEKDKRMSQQSSQERTNGHEHGQRGRASSSLVAEVDLPYLGSNGSFPFDPGAV